MKIISIIVVSLLIVFSSTLVLAQGISGNFPGGSVIVGFDSTACGVGIEGAMRYDSTNKRYELCNGTDWKKIITEAGTAALPDPPATDGRFVITSGTWDGNLGGVAGADAKCLSDLTANSWVGKSNATVDAAHVFAHISDGTTHNNVIASTTYHFAVSGDPSKGGASFTSNASARGPDNTLFWTGANYFGGVKTYWVNKYSGAHELWSTTGSPTASQHCSAWSTNLSSSTGKIGNSNQYRGGRWNLTTNTCDQLNHLLCIVNP